MGIVFIIVIVILCLHKNNSESYTAFSEANTRYWPYYYYSFPYTYKNAGAWPPGMYSRLYYWSPGFYTGTGWQYSFRPGVGNKWWPRNVWIRKQPSNPSYNYVTNGDDFTHNAANYIGWNPLG